MKWIRENLLFTEFLLAARLEDCANLLHNIKTKYKVETTN